MRNIFGSDFARSAAICGSLIISLAAGSANAKTIHLADKGLSIPITVLSGRPVVDGVYLNGRGPFRFLIDTGAETNQVGTGIARQLELKPTFRTEVVTVAGSALVPGGRVAEVRLGNAVASGQEFVFTSMDAIHMLSPGIQGVIGQEFLSHFDYLLDFAGRRIQFGAGEPEGGSRAELDLVNGRPVLETDHGRLVLDSGTRVAILFAGSVGKAGGRVATTAGTGAVSATRDIRLRIGGRVFSGVGASVAGVSAGANGILPASIFQAVFVSNSGKYLVLDPARVRLSAFSQSEGAQDQRTRTHQSN
jgi:hypothetical protein